MKARGRAYSGSLHGWRSPRQSATHTPKAGAGLSATLRVDRKVGAHHGRYAGSREAGASLRLLGCKIHNSAEAHRRATRAGRSSPEYYGTGLASTERRAVGSLHAPLSR